MTDVTDAEHQAAAREVQRLVAVYSDIEELVHLGAYQGGVSGEYDLAVGAIGMIREFLAQPIDEAADFGRSRSELLRLHERIEEMKRDLPDRPVRPARSDRTPARK